jgi:HrpA-like RNA helicase
MHTFARDKITVDDLKRLHNQQFNWVKHTSKNSTYARHSAEYFNCLRKEREPLPVYSKLGEVLDAIKNRIVVISADPGSGKKSL